MLHLAPEQRTRQVSGICASTDPDLQPASWGWHLVLAGAFDEASAGHALAQTLFLHEGFLQRAQLLVQQNLTVAS